MNSNTFFSRSCVYLLLAVIFAGVISFVSPFTFLLNFSHDDSFYYLKTAQNICSGRGSTFDGISPTNGYHPLWLISVVFFFLILKIFGTLHPETLYRLIFLLHSIICIVISLLIFRILSGLFQKNTAGKLFLPVMILSFVLVFIRGVGIESIMNCLIISLLFFLKIKELKSGKVRMISRSVLLSLLFLGRTDYLLSLIPALIMGDYLTTEKKYRNKNAALQVIMIMIISSGYYYYNYFVFGHMMTVSSTKLDTFPKIVFEKNIKTMIGTGGMFYNQMLRLIFFFAVLLFVTAETLFKKNRSQEFRSFTLYLLAAGYGCALYCLMHLCFNSEGIREWYLTLPMLVAVLLSSYVLEPLIRYRQLIYAGLAALAVIVIYKTRIDSNKFGSVYEYSRLLNNKVSEDQAVYQVDFSGMLGFFSERKIVNGDGFINSFEYYEMVKEGKLPDYFDKYDIDLYSTYAFKENEPDSAFTDDYFALKGSGFSFSFSMRDLVFTAPFEFKHLQGERSGSWYLFKIKK